MARDHPLRGQAALWHRLKRRHDLGQRWVALGRAETSNKAVPRHPQLVLRHALDCYDAVLSP